MRFEKNMGNNDSTYNVSAPIPAPPEVKVRTMESDKEMITRGGGAFTGGSGETAGADELRVNPAFSSGVARAPQPYKEPFIAFVKPWMVILLGVIAIVGIVAFLVYAFLLPAISRTPSTEGPSPSLVLPNPIQPIEEDAGAHVSFFRIPPEDTTEVILASGPVSNVSDLQTYGQKLASSISESSRVSGFFEVNIRRSDGVLITLDSFLSKIDAKIFENDFLTKNFSSDFTAFAYKDKNGIWPGYVIKLKKGENQLLIQKDVASRIENSPYLINFFVAPSGLINGGFRDGAMGVRPIRYAAFASGAEFSYSWFNASLLVFSVSRAGLEKAFEYLGR